MFDFELCINIGDSKPTLCYQLAYNIHERKIMNTYIQILEANDWICGCEAPWWSLILLALKSHQEGCSDINGFLWCLCVSYRPLNSVTKNVEFPIPRCADSIEDFGDFSGRIYFISLDTRSNYHQIRARKRYQIKISIFHAKWKKNFQNNAVWFQKCTRFLYCNNDAVLACSITIENYLWWSHNHQWYSLFSNHIPTLLHYFICVTQMFTKYRLSFKLSKSYFLRTEWYNLTANGNCPAASKLFLLQDWPLPPHGISLLSFIGLCCFYNKNWPWFETNIPPPPKATTQLSSHTYSHHGMGTILYYSFLWL